MVDSFRPPKRKLRMVGAFLKKRRESIGLSQRALGQLFSPPVTTQFISNVERGVTPLPPTHVPTLARALKVSEEELMGILEQEYAAKLMGRVGKEAEADPSKTVAIELKDQAWVQELYQKFKNSENEDQREFAEFCLKLYGVKVKCKDDSRGGGQESGSQTPF